jgi:hypothetical protein
MTGRSGTRLAERLRRASSVGWLFGLALLLLGCERSAPPAAPASAAVPAASAKAAPSTRVPASARPDPGQGKHFLWKLESATATVHLLGSIHVAPDDLYPLDPVIEKAFAAADTLVVEVPLDDETQATAAQQAMEIGLYPPDDSLEAHLDAPTKKALASYAAVHPALGAGISRMKPWLAATTVVVARLGEIGYSPERGVDAHFFRRAKERKLRILALESVSEQLQLFAGLSEATQVLMLHEALETLGDLESTIERAFSAWKRGDAAGLDRELLASVRRPEYEPVFKVMFTDRNRRMTEHVEKYLETSSRYFVVVGSGHLVGSGGIVALLRQRGLVAAQQ